MPNYLAMPNQDVRPAVQRALDAFEPLQQELMTVHAPEFAAVDMTMAQAKLLYVVAASPGSTMSEIAHRLGVAISTASGAVDHLVTTGFLTRLDDPANRRQVRVTVTPDGLESLEQMRELGMRQLRSLLERVDDDDLATIERAIRIMTAAIADHATTSDPTFTTDLTTTTDHGSTE
jgi:DNA-binding MarR family transcriptional regulator